MKNQDFVSVPLSMLEAVCEAIALGIDHMDLRMICEADRRLASFSVLFSVCDSPEAVEIVNAHRCRLESRRFELSPGLAHPAP